ncbi:MAG TPA: hypothetical protein VLJ37_04410 [bacterium]|nr:hypothetical protein [bacterium]
MTLARLGFRIVETMTGSHEFEEGRGPKGSHPFSFEGRWGTSDLSEWLKPSSGKFLVADLEGTVTAGGLCRNAPIKGRVELRYFKDRKIRYVFEFRVNGKAYRFVGEKVNIRPWNLPVSHTTCYGVLTEKTTGRLVSRSVTHFRLRTIPAFLGSLRFHRAA